MAIQGTSLSNQSGTTAGMLRRDNVQILWDGVVGAPICVSEKRYNRLGHRVVGFVFRGNVNEVPAVAEGGGSCCMGLNGITVDGESTREKIAVEANAV